MRLKSPTNNPISFGDALGSGHCMVLGPEGNVVPQMFIQSAFAAGAVPADVDADEFVSAPIPTPSKSHQDFIQDGIKVMLERNDPTDFTAAGFPDRRKLAKLVGLNVTAEDVTIAWQALSNDAART
jgi:hypothetical protein